MIKNILSGALYGLAFGVVIIAIAAGVALSFAWLVATFGGWGLLAAILLMFSIVGAIFAIPDGEEDECACDMGCSRCC